MKLSRQPCRIVGVRVGEMSANLLSPAQTVVSAKFVLLADPNRGDQLNAGSFTKTQWSPSTLEAMSKLVEAMEADALRDLFGDEGDVVTTPKSGPPGLSFPPVPVLGGPKT